MTIGYTDGEAFEAAILERLKQETELGAEIDVAPETYGDFLFKYNLTRERTNLLRHLNFKGLNVLEIGAGMGAISRFLAEQSQSLTVIEGAPNRYKVLESRLKGLTNWKGMVSNFQDAQVDEKFDVVVAIGVIEYSEQYLTPGPDETAFDRFVQIALGFLKEDGVLVLASENKLGLKYFSGCAEDHTAKLFDSICGYPVKPSTKTLSRQQLLSLLHRNGLEQVDEYFPFPDYKLVSNVLAGKAVDADKGLAANLATWEPFVNYNLPRASYFPDVLAMRNVAESGLFKEMANSFLVATSRTAESPIRSHLLSRELQNGEVAWHYSLRRKMLARTIFASGEGGIHVSKQHDSASAERAQSYVGEDFTVRWRELPSEPLTSGVHMRPLLMTYVYYGNWAEFLDEIHSFLDWSFGKWNIPGDREHLQPESLEALLINTMVRDWTHKKDASVEEGRWSVFDLEYVLDRPVKKSWFILRNVRCLEIDRAILPSDSPFPHLRRFYENVCGYCGITPDFEADTLLEAKFMSLVSESSVGKSVAELHSFLMEELQLPLGTVRWPRYPVQEHDQERLNRENKQRADLLQQELDAMKARVEVAENAEAELGVPLNQARTYIEGLRAKLSQAELEREELQKILATRFHRMAERIRQRLVRSKR